MGAAGGEQFHRLQQDPPLRVQMAAQFLDIPHHDLGPFQFLLQGRDPRLLNFSGGPVGLVAEQEPHDSSCDLSPKDGEMV